MEKTEEVRIDLGRLFGAVRRRSWVIALVAALFSAAAFLASRYIFTPQYTASAKFYITNHSGDSHSRIDLNTARDLVDSCIVILNTWDTLSAVATQSGADYAPTDLQEMISAEAVDHTEIFQVSVTCPRPDEAATIALAVTQVLPGKIAAITGETLLEIAEMPRIPKQPSTMIPPKITLIGFLAGFVLATGLVMLLEFFDDRIRSRDDIQRICDTPVFASLPQGNIRPVEGCHLLQAKLQLCLPQENGVRIIGITSPNPTDASALTAIHLASTLAETGSRTVVIDCDLRQGMLAQKFHLPQIPGLSDHLAGQVELSGILRSWGEHGLDVICAGTETSRPLSLLRCRNMQALLDQLSQNYDEILLSLPPTDASGNCLVIGSCAQGLLLAVQQNVCREAELREALRQAASVNIRILGIVLRESADTPLCRQHSQKEPDPV